MLVKIVQNFDAVEGWQVGDVVEITTADTLIREGKVVPVSMPVEPDPEPVSAQEPATEEAHDEVPEE